MLCGSFRSGLSHFVNQTAGHATLGRRARDGLSREFVQLFGSAPQLFKNVDPGVGGRAARMRQHDAVILLDGRHDLVLDSAQISDHSSVSMFLQENPPSQRDKSFRLSDRSGTVADVFYVLGLTVKLLLPILEDRPDRIDGEKLGRLQN
jgi:hypothetical protein